MDSDLDNPGYNLSPYAIYTYIDRAVTTALFGLVWPIIVRIVYMHRISESSNLIHLSDENASVTIHLHGATIINWQINDRPLLFLSEKAVMDGSKPIRGGIPIVFRIWRNYLR